MTTIEETGMINLASKEGDVYKVPFKAAMMSQLVKTTLADEEDDEVAEDASPKDLPLPNVSAPVLHKVIEFCIHYQEEEMTPIQQPLKSSKIEDLVQNWYAEFCNVEQNMLFDLVAAANFMDIKPLLDLTCLAVSINLKGRSAAELREIFKMSADLTPEQRAAMQLENRVVENMPQENAAAGADGDN